MTTIEKAEIVARAITAYEAEAHLAAQEAMLFEAKKIIAVSEQHHVYHCDLLLRQLGLDD